MLFVVVVVVCPCLALTIFVSCLLCKHKQQQRMTAFDMPVAKRATNQTTKSSTTTAITVATRATGRQMFSVFESFSSRFSSSSSLIHRLRIYRQKYIHTQLSCTFYIYDAAFVLCLLCDCCIFPFPLHFCCSFLSLFIQLTVGIISNRRYLLYTFISTKSKQ